MKKTKDTRPASFGYYWSDEERRGLIHNVLVETESNTVCETFVEILLGIRKALDGEDGPLTVRNEIDELIDLAFQQSEAYGVALDLYHNRHYITGDANLHRVLDEYRKKYLRRPRERTVKP